MTWEEFVDQFWDAVPEQIWDALPDAAVARIQAYLRYDDVESARRTLLIAGGARTTDLGPQETYVDLNSRQWFRNEPIIANGVVTGYKAVAFTPPKQSAEPTAEPKKNTTDPYLWNGFQWQENPWYVPPAKQSGEPPNLSAEQPVYWNGNQWVQNPNYISPEEREAQAAGLAAAQQKTTWGIQKDLFDREAAARAETLKRQEVSTNQWIAAQQGNAEAVRQAGYAAQEERYQQLMPPVKADATWIDAWRYRNTPRLRPKPPSGIGSWTESGKIGFAGSQSEAERKGLTGWLKPGQTGTDPGAMWQNKERQTIMSDPMYPGGRPETDAEYNYRTKTLPLRAAEGWGQGSSGLSLTTGGSSDPYISSALAEWYKYNPEPGGGAAREAFINWVARGGDRPTTLSRPEWEAQRGGFLEAQLEERQRRGGRGHAGPELPTWAYGLGAPTQRGGSKTFLDVRALQRSKGSTLSPVGATTWAKMLPSEREGLRGLVQASGKNWGDYMGRSERLWGASRPGVQAQRRNRTF